MNFNSFALDNQVNIQQFEINAERQANVGLGYISNIAMQTWRLWEPGIYWVLVLSQEHKGMTYWFNSLCTEKWKNWKLWVTYQWQWKCCMCIIYAVWVDILEFSHWLDYCQVLQEKYVKTSKTVFSFLNLNYVWLQIANLSFPLHSFHYPFFCQPFHSTRK